VKKIVLIKRVKTLWTPNVDIISDCTPMSF
jgi:hypothetical protein